ncbi:LysR family transcriptional regulator [Pseudomonas chlororaphis]|uniref:LysR family transcriptional regulator n=1 Tax=Pseudomonas chlororaphis TaxID=587753 RepID=A0AB34C616_9PSED|nr:LysR family transcriptional regulator [Pseudomonas chlororaphis]KAA5842478.1 LysR family transcriptional regulator [Pseudomonas chlororaphis]
MSRFDWNLLVSLDSLLRQKNVTAAAEEIGVSQSTMSGMLSRLRDQLDDPLLVRVGSNYELSGRGLELMEPVRQAILSVQELVRPTENLNLATTKRCIRIMASEFTQLLILPYFFRRVTELAPALTFEVLPISDPAARVYHGDVDVALTAAPLTDVPSSCTSLLRTRNVLEASLEALVDEHHPLSDQPSLEEFFSYPRIETRFPGIGVSVEEDALSFRHFAKNQAIIIPSFLVAPAMIAGTDRVCVLPKLILDFIRMSSPMRILSLPAGYRSSITLRALWHVRHDYDPLQRWIRSMLYESAAQLEVSKA